LAAHYLKHSLNKQKRNEMVLPTRPTVSIVTPTYNRRLFIPRLIDCIIGQTYPHELIEWCIYDDGTDKVQDIIEGSLTKLGKIKVNYMKGEEGEKVNVGTKRNKLNDIATGQVIVCMDDDDFYPPERVGHAVDKLRSSKVELVGSSEMFCFFTDDKSIWKAGPFPVPNHATFGTFAYTNEYGKRARCDEKKINGEEREFTFDYKTPLVQLNSSKAILVTCHTDNTFDKKKLRDGTNRLFVRTGLKLRDFVRKAELREFYNGLKA
jgi:glycosyltransferase involved in cell wall biosynthesis